jgi:hypothetical protein
MKTKTTPTKNLSDNQSIMTIEISDEDLFTLMKQAHEKNITLNQLINNILLEEILIRQKMELPEQLEKGKNNDSTR